MRQSHRMLLPLLQSLGGVAPTRTLANEHGIGARQVDSAVARGEVVRLRQGWVALPSADRDLQSAVRVGGALTCISVLRRHGIWCDPGHDLHVRLASGTGRAGSPHDRSVPLSAKHSVRVHRPGWAPPPAAVDGLATALAMAVVCQSRLDAISTLDSALNRRVISTSALHQVMAPLPAKYRDYLRLVDSGAQSGLETKSRLSLRSHRVRMQSQVWIADVGRVDLLVGERLVLELDGWRWHSRRDDFEEDRRRDLALTSRGFQVLRLSYDQVMHHWPECEAAILGLIRQRTHLWPRVGRGTV